MSMYREPIDVSVLPKNIAIPSITFNTIRDVMLSDLMTSYGKYVFLNHINGLTPLVKVQVLCLRSYLSNFIKANKEVSYPELESAHESIEVWPCDVRVKSIADLELTNQFVGNFFDYYN